MRWKLPSKKFNMKNKKIRAIIFLILAAVGIFFDQWTKRLAVLHLMNQPSKTIIPGVFELSYLENPGAAFGMMRGKQFLFFVIMAVVILTILWLLVRLPLTKRFFPLLLCMVLIFSGAIGNSIDRMSQGYVVDFLYFSLIDFPVFNVADIYVTVGTIILIIFAVFVYKDDDFQFDKE